MKIGITGATGQLGRLVAEQLKDKVGAGNLVALIRSTQKGADLGIEIREANYDRPETFETALKGIDTLLLISASEIGKRLAQHQHVIDAAKKNNVKWIVYTSILHADTSTIGLAGEHLSTEKALIESGIPYTILRNGWYNENYIGSVSGGLAGGALLGSALDGKISAAAREDYAAAAVAVLTSEGHQGKIYELAGDEAFTMSELAAEVSKQSGKNIPYNNMPEDEYAKILSGFGLPAGLPEAIASWDVGISKGDLYNNSKDLSRLTGRPTGSINDIVAQVCKPVK